MRLSKCRTCFRPVLWARSETGSWLPPLDPELRQLRDTPSQVLLSVATVTGVPERIPVAEVRVASFHVCPGAPRRQLFVDAAVEPGDDAPLPVNLQPVVRPPADRVARLVASRVPSGSSLIARCNKDTRQRWWSTKRRREVMSVPCPYCRAAVGDPCENPATGQFLQQPHPDRLKVAPAWVMPGGSDTPSPSWSRNLKLQAAAEVPCPRCRAEAGDPCRRQQDGKYIKYAHRERLVTEPEYLEQERRRMEYFLHHRGGLDLLRQLVAL